jgi:hypothetical protein
VHFISWNAPPTKSNNVVPLLRLRVEIDNLRLNDEFSTSIQCQVNQWTLTINKVSLQRACSIVLNIQLPRNHRSGGALSRGFNLNKQRSHFPGALISICGARVHNSVIMISSHTWKTHLSVRHSCRKTCDRGSRSRIRLRLTFYLCYPNNLVFYGKKSRCKNLLVFCRCCPNNTGLNHRRSLHDVFYWIGLVDFVHA